MSNANKGRSAESIELVRVTPDERRCPTCKQKYPQKLTEDDDYDNFVPRKKRCVI